MQLKFIFKSVKLALHQYTCVKMLPFREVEGDGVSPKMSSPKGEEKKKATTVNF